MTKKSTSTQGSRLVRQFFKDCAPVDFKKLDFSHLKQEMLEAHRDHHLCLFWSRIAPHLNLDPPLNTAREIRIWMSQGVNQDRLAEITTLDLSELQLRIIPPEIIYLRGLTELLLGHNQLTSLPPEMGNLSALTVLDLSYNQLTSLPPK